MTDDMDELRRQCLLGARLLWRELREVYGHVSARLPDGTGFVCKLMRLPPDGMDPDGVSRFDNDGRKVDGDDAPQEIFIHSEIYKLRPDVNAVVHTHPHASTAVSVAGRTVFAITHQSMVFGEGLPLFKADFVETPQLGAELAGCLGAHQGVLMKGHGAVLVGAHVPAAVGYALYLEQTAHQLLWASTLGTPEPMEPRHYEHRFHKTEGQHGTGALALWRQLVWELENESSPR